MKTMTCEQMGGPCDAPFHGNKADEVIKAQDNHLKEMVAGGDETHRSALKSMQDRWKHPLSGMGWYHKDKEGLCCSSRRLIGLPLPLLDGGAAPAEDRHRGGRPAGELASGQLVDHRAALGTWGTVTA